MNYIQLLLTLKKLSEELNKKKSEEIDPAVRSQYELQLDQIKQEIKRIETMRSYMS